MFLGTKEDDKPHRGSVFVGYDLGERYTQISYCLFGESDVETVAPVVGTKQYNIPFMLCKRKGTNQWLYGKEAVKSAGEETMCPVDDILNLARKGTEIELDGETYDPVALLTLFIRRSLGLMSFIVPVEHIGALLFTVDKMDDAWWRYFYRWRQIFRLKRSIFISRTTRRVFIPLCCTSLRNCGRIRWWSASMTGNT
jgi:hypothetical protein